MRPHTRTHDLSLTQGQLPPMANANTQTHAHICARTLSHTSQRVAFLQGLNSPPPKPPWAQAHAHAHARTHAHAHITDSSHLNAHNHAQRTTHTCARANTHTRTQKHTNAHHGLIEPESDWHSSPGTRCCRSRHSRRGRKRISSSSSARTDCTRRPSSPVCARVRRDDNMS